MGKIISGVYPVEYPVKYRCKNGNFSTNTGNRACTWHGGIDRDYIPGESEEEFIFAPSPGIEVDTYAMQQDKVYRVLQHIKGMRFNTDLLIRDTGWSNRDINIVWKKNAGGVKPSRVATDISQFMEGFSPWDDQEVLDIIAFIVQRNVKDNLELLAEKYSFKNELAGIRSKNKNKLIIGLASLAAFIWLEK